MVLRFEFELIWWEYFQLIVVSEAKGFNPYMIHCHLHTCNIEK
jgi:hypothetical protein